ncbi:MAG: metallophosphoesterase family protein [bacterium]
MRYAIISDIHGNLEALQRVLEEIETRNIGEILCLGDVVGYGPNPNECVEIVRKHAKITLAGNHDYAPLGRLDLSYFNPWARSAVEWTGEELTPASTEFLMNLPLMAQMDGFAIVHATPLNPEEWNYITTVGDAVINFPEFQGQVCFIGHSHVPLNIVMNGNGACDVEKQNPMPLLEGKRYIINVGSVGQPRDFNSKASFGVYDSDEKVFELVRTVYDLASTQKKIRDAGLPDFLAERLARGQ